MAPGIITDGWLIGAASGQVMTDGGNVQTGSWKPGDTSSATSTVDSLGLGQQLADAVANAGQQAQQVAQSIATAAGRALVNALLSGQSAADAAKALLAAVKDQAHAAAIALGQIVDAIGDAASEWYRSRSVEWVEWQTEGDGKVCAICAANEAAGPVRFGDPFPSGDIAPPAHPRCRCCLSPARAPEGAEPEQPQAPAVPEPESPEEPAETGPQPAEPEPAEEPPPFEPLQFATPAAAQAWLTDNAPDLTPDQRAAVKWFTASGSGLTNWQLRDGNELPADIAKNVDLLDSAMSPLPADLVLDRVVGSNAFSGADLASLEGKTVSDPAFSSTSLISPPWRSGEVAMHIAAPAGTPSIITAGSADIADEREILLARGTSLAVTKVTQDSNGRWEMWLTVVPGDGTETVAKAAADDRQAYADRMKDAVYTVTGTAPAWAMAWPADR